MNKLFFLTCSCCGEKAPAFAQHPNHDTGYGLCGKCADRMLRHQGMQSCAERIAPAKLQECHGQPGVHWLPLDHKFQSTSQADLFFWVEETDPEGMVGGPTTYMVVAGVATAPIPASEACDDWFKYHADALEIAYQLSQGEEGEEL